ncbi:MAG: hypothetical protein FJX67_12335 [Alphaproteobacteria bacterium]|nr:hypothetical protein [Alphaproteobacteria bacterium]
MLELMRRKAATWVFRVLGVFLIGSFALWGVGDYVRRSTLPETVAEVGDLTISGRDLSTQFRREMNRLRTTLGQSLDTETAQRLGLVDRTLDSLVVDRLFRIDAQKHDVVISDDRVAEQVRREPAFQGALGQFDRNQFVNVLIQNDMTEEFFVGSLREQMVRTQLTDALTAGIVIPNAVIDAVYRYRNERRVADMVAIPVDSIAVPPEPTEAEIAAYHEANPELFSRPERREITLATLDPEDVAGGIKPTDDRIRDAYEARRASLQVPERRAIRQVLARDEATAKAVSAALQANPSLDEAVKTAGGDKATVADLGLLARGDVPLAALVEPAFALALGTPSAAVSTPLGWHILVVDRIEPGHLPSLAEVHDQIVRDLVRDESVEAVVALANKFEDSLGAGQSLEVAAQANGLKLADHKTIDAQGRDEAGNPLPTIPADPRFLSSVFELESGQSSTLRETEAGGFYMVRVDKVIPRALRPLGEVRADVIAGWKRNQRLDQARKKADEIVAAIKDGKSLGTVASTMDLRLVSSRPFNRFALEPEIGVPAALAAALFRVKPGEATSVQSPDGYVVGQLTRIVDADPAADPSGRTAVRERLQTTFSAELLIQYADELRARYGVKIDRNAVAQLFPTSSP